MATLRGARHPAPPPVPEPPLLVSMQEAARLCGISVRKMNALCLEHRIPSVRIDGRRLVPRAELLAWVAAEVAQAEQAMAAGARTDLRFRQVGA